MPTRTTLVALGLIVLGAVIVHLWGITGDLPYPPDVDEPIFLRAAVGMLVRHSLNPEWFGNPGSTVIYPIAALVEIWYQAAKHVPPFAHPMPGIGRELVADPMPFYLIGRLVVAAYGIGCVIVTWLLGRRILGDLGGLLAALFLPATAIVVAYGQIVRTDMAGLFFALLSLWLAIRAIESRRPRDWVLAAIAIGLAISSRYFFAILIVPYLVAAAASVRAIRSDSGSDGTPIRSMATPFLAVLAIPLTVAITSPFLLLDLHAVILDLQHENRTVHPGADGLSPIGNLLWYVGTIAPATFGWPTLALSALGLVVVARRRPRETAVLVAFAASYLVGVSASPLHWDRYIIPLVPLVGIFASGAALAIGSALSRAVARRGRLGQEGADRRLLGLIATVAVVLLLLAPSINRTVANARQRSLPSTRAVATEWVTQNVPQGSGIASEQGATYLPSVRGRVLQIFYLASRSMDRYRADGYRYLVTSSDMVNRFNDPMQYPKEHAFYEELSNTGRLIATFEPGPDRPGPVIRVYDLKPAETAGSGSPTSSRTMAM